PDRYLIVRYETLVEQPEATLRQVCAFIGEPYTPAMLTMEGAPAHRNRGGNSSYGTHTPGQISTTSIGKFRKVLSPRDLAFMQAYVGRQMRAYGYELEPLHLSLSDRLIFASVDWPSNMARILAWHVLEAFRNRWGRAPAPHTIIPAANPTRA
ncbi:MAG TPA: sulfotransferase, partial [Herpetosiphonaceae bacterium]